MLNARFEFVLVPLVTAPPIPDLPALVADADGVEHLVRPGRLEMANGRMCLVALQLETRDGISRLRFRDCTELWVSPGVEAVPVLAV